MRVVVVSDGEAPSCSWSGRERAGGRKLTGCLTTPRLAQMRLDP